MHSSAPGAAARMISRSACRAARLSSLTRDRYSSIVVGLSVMARHSFSQHSVVCGSLVVSAGDDVSREKPSVASKTIRAELARHRGRRATTPSNGFRLCHVTTPSRLALDTATAMRGYGVDDILLG